jgi:hypothetical protein
VPNIVNSQTAPDARFIVAVAWQSTNPADSMKQVKFDGELTARFTNELGTWKRIRRIAFVNRRFAGPSFVTRTTHVDDANASTGSGEPVNVTDRSGGCTVIVSVALLSVSSPSGITPSGSAVTVIDNGPG